LELRRVVAISGFLVCVLFSQPMIAASLPRVLSLHPGVDTITIAGDATFGPGTEFQVVVVPGVTPPALIVGGTLTLNQPTLVVSNIGAIPVGSVITIVEVQSASPIAGTFAGLAQSAVIVTTSGQAFRISYVGGTGNDVTLTAIDAAAIPMFDPRGLIMLMTALGIIGLITARR
jgi:hypothetical protein